MMNKTIHDWFIKHRKKLAIAESCTGGNLAANLTTLPGASEYFLGSFVVYSNEMKLQALGISKKTLDAHGPVSEETVREMLAGVFAKTSADFAIAVTGIAGPSGGSHDKPVGTICAAIGERGKSPDVATFRLKGDRQDIIQQATHSLLDALGKKVEKGIPAFPLSK